MYEDNNYLMDTVIPPQGPDASQQGPTALYFISRACSRYSTTESGKPASEAFNDIGEAARQILQYGSSKKSAHISLSCSYQSSITAGSCTRCTEPRRLNSGLDPEWLLFC
jgi:hypothetical protein